MEERIFRFPPTFRSPVVPAVVAKKKKKNEKKKLILFSLYIQITSLLLML